MLLSRTDSHALAMFNVAKSPWTTSDLASFDGCKRNYAPGETLPDLLVQMPDASIIISTLLCRHTSHGPHQPSAVALSDENVCGCDYFAARQARRKLSELLLLLSLTLFLLKASSLVSTLVN